MINQIPHADYLEDNTPTDADVHAFMSSLAKKYGNLVSRKGIYRIPNPRIGDDAQLTIVLNKKPNCISLEYCPPKLATGKNLTGSINPMFIKNLPLKIFSDHMNSSELNDDLYQKFLDAYRRRADTTMIDLTIQMDVDPDQKDVLLCADTSPYLWKGKRPQQYVDVNGKIIETAIIFGIRHEGKEGSCLMYCKYAHVLAVGKLHLYTEEELEMMKKTIRVEFRFRYQEMKREGLRDMSKVKSKDLFDVFQRNFNKLTDSTISVDLSTFTAQEKDLVDCWKRGKLDQWKKLKSRATYFRHKKSLKNKGLDITKPYGVDAIIGLNQQQGG
jgi:hypothetical protein